MAQHHWTALVFAAEILQVKRLVYYLSQRRGCVPGGCARRSGIELLSCGKEGSCRIHPFQGNPPQRKFATSYGHHQLDSCSTSIPCYSQSSRSPLKVASRFHQSTHRRGIRWCLCFLLRQSQAGSPGRTGSLAICCRSNHCRSWFQPRARGLHPFRLLTSTGPSDLRGLAAHWGGYAVSTVCAHQMFPGLQDRVCSCRSRPFYDPEGIHWKCSMLGAMGGAAQKSSARPEDRFQPYDQRKCK